MGTVIGMLVLAFIAYLIKKNTGLHLHQWVSKKYQEHLDAKEMNK
ncbi:hypothetical protein AB4343_16020 [Vibrio breoganii]|nr:hypothetical protein [Vibrio breoganii]MDN3715477.1 hypothetical protein [Vibrio breoganii]